MPGGENGRLRFPNEVLREGKKAPSYDLPKKPIEAASRGVVTTSQFTTPLLGVMPDQIERRTSELRGRISVFTGRETSESGHFIIPMPRLV